MGEQNTEYCYNSKVVEVAVMLEEQNTIQYSAPLALPQPQQPWNYNNIQYSAPLALPQPQQQLMEYSVSPQTNQLQQFQTQPQLMDHSSNTQTPRYPPLPQPQLMDHSSNTQTPHYPTLPQPQLMDYNVNPQNSALPAPVDDDYDKEDDLLQAMVKFYRRREELTISENKWH